VRVADVGVLERARVAADVEELHATADRDLGLADSRVVVACHGGDGARARAGVGVGVVLDVVVVARDQPGDVVPAVLAGGSGRASRTRVALRAGGALRTGRPLGTLGARWPLRAERLGSSNGPA
jgi:hypothetical protein